jgi:hypothetical protein
MLTTTTLNTRIIIIIKNKHAEEFVARSKSKKIAVRVFVMRNRKNNVKKPKSAHKNLQSLARNPPVQVKTSELELVMAMVKERRYMQTEEYEGCDMFHTDRNIVYIPSSRRTERMREMFMMVEIELLIISGRNPTPKRCRANCSKEGAIRRNSNNSHNSGHPMQGATVGWMSGSSNNSY